MFLNPTRLHVLPRPLPGQRPPSTSNNIGIKLCERLRKAYSQHKWDEVLSLLMMVRAHYLDKFPRLQLFSILFHATFGRNSKIDLRQVYLDDFVLLGSRFAAQIQYLHESYTTRNEICSSVFELHQTHPLIRFQPASRYGSALYNSVQIYYKYHSFYETAGDDPKSLKEGLELYQACYESIHEVTKKSHKLFERKYIKSYYRPVHGAVFWLLGPALHLYEFLRANDVTPIPKTYDEIISEYLEMCPDDLGSLKIIARYLLIYHKEDQFDKVVPLIHKICRMCPGDPMVLQYVKALVTYDLMPTESMVDTDDLMPEILDDFGNLISVENNSHDKCILAGPESLSVIMRICLLTRLVEYSQWNTKLEPWSLLYAALHTVCQAWKTCWHCSGCSLLRDKFIELIPSIFFWSTSFFLGSIPKFITLDDAYVYAYKAFAGYVLLYEKHYAKRILKLLKDCELLHPLSLLKEAYDDQAPFSKELSHFRKDLRALKMEHSEKLESAPFHFEDITEKNEPSLQCFI